MNQTVSRPPLGITSFDDFQTYREWELATRVGDSIGPIHRKPIFDQDELRLLIEEALRMGLGWGVGEYQHVPQGYEDRVSARPYLMPPQVIARYDHWLWMVVGPDGERRDVFGVMK